LAALSPSGDAGKSSPSGGVLVEKLDSDEPFAE